MRLSIKRSLITLCGKCSDQGKKRELRITEDIGEPRHLLQHEVVRSLLEEELPEQKSSKWRMWGHRYAEETGRGV